MTITPESVRTLIDSEDFGDRIKAINELRHLEKAVAYELLKPLITDKNVRVRYAAISQLDSLGDINRAEALEIVKDRLYNDPESDVRAAAADTIAGLKFTEAFTDLQTVYGQTNDWLIQFSIIAALGELGNPDAFGLLKETLQSDNALLQTTAISALGELGNVEAVDLLIPFADNDDWQIRHRVAQALGNLGGEKALEVLQQLSQDESNIVVEEAKHHLHR